LIADTAPKIKWKIPYPPLAIKWFSGIRTRDPNASHAPVAQLDRALPSGGKGQRFESPRAHHIDQVFSTSNQFIEIFCGSVAEAFEEKVKTTVLTKNNLAAGSNGKC
jgi:hypothetical protein